MLSPLGIEEPTSRRVAGALLRVESSLPPPPPEPTLSRQILTFMARRPKLAGAVDEERQHLLAKADDDDEAQEKGMTAFLLKFAEGLEETGDSRMFISAFTIGISYFLGGLIPLVSAAMDVCSLTANKVVTAAVLLLQEGTARLVVVDRHHPRHFDHFRLVQDLLHRRAGRLPRLLCWCCLYSSRRWCRRSCFLRVRRVSPFHETRH